MPWALIKEKEEEGPHNKHSNIQYQFLSILYSPDPHNKQRNIQYHFISILLSPEPHKRLRCSRGSVLALEPKFAGSNPAEAVGFLGRKNPQHAFLRRGSKAVGPMSNGM